MANIKYGITETVRGVYIYKREREFVHQYIACSCNELVFLYLFNFFLLQNGKCWQPLCTLALVANSSNYKLCENNYLIHTCSKTRCYFEVLNWMRSYSHCDCDKWYFHFFFWLQTNDTFCRLSPRFLAYIDKLLVFLQVYIYNNFFPKFATCFCHLPLLHPPYVYGGFLTRRHKPPSTTMVMAIRESYLCLFFTKESYVWHRWSNFLIVRIVIWV